MANFFSGFNLGPALPPLGAPAAAATPSGAFDKALHTFEEAARAWEAKGGDESSNKSYRFLKEFVAAVEPWKKEEQVDGKPAAAAPAAPATGGMFGVGAVLGAPAQPPARHWEVTYRNSEYPFRAFSSGAREKPTSWSKETCMTKEEWLERYGSYEAPPEEEIEVVRGEGYEVRVPLEPVAYDGFDDATGLLARVNGINKEMGVYTRVIDAQHTTLDALSTESAKLLERVALAREKHARLQAMLLRVAMKVELAFWDKPETDEEREVKKKLDEVQERLRRADIRAHLEGMVLGLELRREAKAVDGSARGAGAGFGLALVGGGASAGGVGAMDEESKRRTLAKLSETHRAVRCLVDQVVRRQGHMEVARREIDAAARRLGRGGGGGGAGGAGASMQEELDL